MISKEYMTVKELSKIHQVGERHIRKMIDKIKPTTTPQLITKDSNNRYLVHHILSSRFKPARSAASKFYALTVTPATSFTEKDIHRIMGFVIEQLEGPRVEISYTIERCKADGKNHLHCYINCQQRNKLIRSIKLGFSEVNYHEQDIFDLENWKKYMTKEGSKITTLKKK